MTQSPAWQPVVALALFDSSSRLLLQQRLARKRHDGCWEFPGGKVEPGEHPRAALVREIAEELAIRLDPADLAPALFEEEPGAPPIALLLYTARRWCGTVSGLDGQSWRWLTRGEADALLLAPMDHALLARLEW